MTVEQGGEFAHDSRHHLTLLTMGFRAISPKRKKTEIQISLHPYLNNFLAQFYQWGNHQMVSK